MTTRKIKSLGTSLRQTDIARHAGVSPGTVSKVINGRGAISEAVRNRVVQAAQDIGYKLPDLSQQVVESGQRCRIKLITFYQFLTRHSSYFHSEIICSILEECEKAGIDIETVLLSRDHPNDLSQYEAKLRESSADAAMFVGIDDPEFLEPVRRSGIPAVIVNGVDPESQFDSVSPSLRDGSRLATRHLLSLGHTEIIHVTHLYRKLIHRRLDGFREALEEAGVAFSMQKNVINLPGGHFSAEEASDAIYERITQGKIKATAFFCVSDYTALGVIQGIQRSGRSVPSDYSVTSFDDLPLSQLVSPPITSAGVSRQELGRLAVQRLLSRLKEPQSSPLRIEVGAHLAIRSSTSALLKK